MRFSPDNSHRSPAAGPRRIRWQFLGLITTILAANAVVCSVAHPGALEPHSPIRASGSAISTAPSVVPRSVPVETYRQTIVVQFDSDSSARSATMVPTPLWNGLEWAVSGRWDDLHPNNARMRDLLEAHGHRGTFYLNGWLPSLNQVGTTTDAPEARELLRGGNSIGGHGLTHPWISHCSRNRMFEEILGVRMLWEAAIDSPVISYAFSYSNFRNDEEGDAVQADLVRLLERAGFYHVANEPGFDRVPTALILSPILPPDGAPIEAFAEAALRDAAYREAHPIFTYSMHAWYTTPRAWSDFADRLDLYGRRPSWWYCNQNQYAAYRSQFRLTRLRSVAREGPQLSFEWERPVLLDLNDPVPLTFEVRGVPRTAVVALRCESADTAPSADLSGSFRFHLWHDRDRSLPRSFGLAPPNASNRFEPVETDRDSQLPGLRALLSYRDGKLDLRVDNVGTSALTGCRITYRLPLAWKDGVVRRPLPDLAPGSSGRDVWEPEPAESTYKERAGEALLVAQIDGVLGDRRFRLYASCRPPAAARDPSYPQAGFARLGPIPANQLDLDRLGLDLAANVARTQPWRLDDDSVLFWQTDDDPFQPPHFDPERLRLTGRWSGWNGLGTFVLRSDVVALRARSVRARNSPGLVRSMFLNGTNVTGLDGFALAVGTNRLVVASAAYPDLYLRLVDSRTGERVSDLRYQVPRLETTSTNPYSVPIGPETEPPELWPWRLADGRVRIDWMVSGVLQSAATVEGPWTDMPSVGRSVTLHPTASRLFFRLRSKKTSPDATP